MMKVLNSFKLFLNNWDLRILVVVSLLLQVFLILTANLRKTILSRLIIGTIWTWYLLADLVATCALGVLSRSQSKLTTPYMKKHEFIYLDTQLTALWAPFLLLHLGGPDVITAFSLADNELWLRHGLNLAYQVALAASILARFYPEGQLFVSSVLVFIAGLLKYGERTWALKCGSMDGLRISMLGKPDPGPDYVNTMNQYAAKLRAGMPAAINVKQALEEGLDINVVRPLPQSASLQQQEAAIIRLAHEFFKIFKGLFVESIFSFKDREKSRAFFLSTDAELAFKVVEIELSFAYDVLYTKASVSRTFPGQFIRGISLVSIVTAAVSFGLVAYPKLGILSHHRNSQLLRVRVYITCALFLGAIIIEIFSLFRLIFSDWIVVALLKLSNNNSNARSSDDLQQKSSENTSDFGRNCSDIGREWFQRFILFLRPVQRERWSNKISQYNLLSFCLKDRQCPPSTIKKIIGAVGLKEKLNSYFYTHHVKVTPELRGFIFKELKDRSEDAQELSNYRFIADCKGGWTLQKDTERPLKDLLGWSIDQSEFDESLLMWHIATDICITTSCLPLLKEETKDDYHMKIAKELSNYLLYLLVVNPLMLASTAVVGVKKYDDTCAEVAEFFKQKPKKIKKLDACRLLLSINTDHRPAKVKGDRCKSVLWDGCELAKTLVLLGEKRWEIMSKVLFEMVCYVAIHCRGYYHAEQLSRGGELLTFTWFLLTHFGMGLQFLIESGASSANVVDEFN